MILELSGKASERGAAFGEQLASEIKIINDPAKVTTAPSVLFYVKNVGETTMPLETTTTLVDGVVVTTTNSFLGSETTFRPGAVAQLSYTASPALASGDHAVRVVMENGVDDTLRFRVS